MVGESFSISNPLTGKAPYIHIGSANPGGEECLSWWQMSSSGQFHIARDIFYDWTAEDKPWCALALWLYLIGRGQYQDTTVTFLGHQFFLSRGQLVTTASHLCDVAAWPRQRLRSFLLRCEKDGKIISRGTPNGTVITILNYDKWQASTEQPTIQPTKQPTSQQLQTAVVATGQPTIQPTIQPQSIKGVQYQKKILKDIVEQKPLDPPPFEAMPKRKSRVKDTTPEVLDVLAYLNLKIGSKYSVAPDLVARFKQGATVDQAKAIIDKKVAEWGGTEMAPWLKPSTLFCKKHFDEYLNQPGVQSPGKLSVPIPIWTEEQDLKHKAQARKWLDDDKAKEDAR